MKALFLAPLLMLLASTGCVVGDGTGGGGGGDGTGGGGGGGTSENGTTKPDAAVPQQTQACTNAVYDPCTDNTQCTSGKCQLFQQSGFQVCTQTCTPGDSSTCPTQNGQPAQCNNMGICKPVAATTCTR